MKFKSTSLVYAKSGVSFTAGLGFVFTGLMNGADWEIDYPSSSGIKIHGITTQYTDEFSSVPAEIFIAGPQYGVLSSAISAGDEVSCDTNGKFFLKGMTDLKVGVALTSGSLGGTAVIILTE